MPIDSGLQDCVQMLSLNADGTAAQHHAKMLDIETFGTGTFGYETAADELAARFLLQEATVTGAALTAMRTHHDTVVSDLLSEGQ